MDQSGNPSRGELLETKPVEDHEYLFYRDQNGEPKGQIKVWSRFRIGMEQRERRMPFKELPKAMQEKFLKFAGKETETELV